MSDAPRRLPCGCPLGRCGSEGVRFTREDRTIQWLRVDGRDAAERRRLMRWLRENRPAIAELLKHPFVAEVVKRFDAHVLIPRKE